MHLRLLGFLYVLVLCGGVQSFAQQTGPRTLENLLNSDDKQKPAATAEADATDAGSKRPAGTVARPENGVQHPVLDRAWADYDAAVGKATESIKAAINKRFDAAAAKGDLDTAEKWQMALEKFEKARQLSGESETEADVRASVADYKKALEELTKAYEAVVKSLTMEKKIAEAKAVRAESLSIVASPHGSEAVQAATIRNEKETKAKVKKVPAMKGAWLFSNGHSVDITQRGNTIAWAFQSNAGYKHLITCEWDGEQFIGVCVRTSPGSGCITRLRMVITMLSETRFTIDSSALDANCDLPLGWKESAEGLKR